MRLLIATDAFPPKCGGSGWSTFYLARALAARGHAVQVVQPRAHARGIVKRVYADLPVVEFGYGAPALVPLRAVQAMNLPAVRAWQGTSALNREFAAYLAERARDTDVIHAQHLLTIPAAVTAGRAAQVPVVSTVRDYWPVCLYGTLWRDNAICPICRGAELTLCLRQKYGAAAKFAGPLIPLVERELARRQRALRGSAAIVAVSHSVAEKLRGVVDPSKLSVVPNLIDLAETRGLVQTADLAQPPSPYLLFIGKLNDLKGADLLPEILKRARVELPLVVVGDGPLTETLAHAPNVQVRGWLSNQESLRLLARATALLFPSRWAEPLSRVLLEAQALGAPTVALNTGGTRDIIQHDVNGLLAPDVDDFARQLARLVNDPALGERLSRGARRTAEEKFSSTVIVHQIESVYTRVLSQPSFESVVVNQPITV